MGLDLCQNFPVARQTFEEADAALGFSLSKLCFEGPAEDLQLTANTQPAILACSMAAYRVLAERGIAYTYVAGHSLGEYSALVAAGSLPFADALGIVRHRGLYMQEAVPVGAGAMAALLGIGIEKIEEICRAAAQGEVVSPANINTPEQIVVAGHAGAVKRVMEQALAAGAKRAVPLAVSAPFHCSLMRPAQERLEKDLRQTTFAPLHIPLVTNADAAVITSGDEAREALVRQVTLPVRWEESMHELIEQGATTFVEVGPGRVLSGLLRQIERSVHCVNVEDAKSLETALERLAQAQGESAETS